MDYVTAYQKMCVDLIKAFFHFCLLSYTISCCEAQNSYTSCIVIQSYLHNSARTYISSVWLELFFYPFFSNFSYSMGVFFLLTHICYTLHLSRTQSITFLLNNHVVSCDERQFYEPIFLYLFNKMKIFFVCVTVFWKV
jgi:hypothetical protein